MHTRQLNWYSCVGIVFMLNTRHSLRAWFWNGHFNSHGILFTVAHPPVFGHLNFCIYSFSDIDIFIRRTVLANRKKQLACDPRNYPSGREFKHLTGFHAKQLFPRGKTPSRSHVVLDGPRMRTQLAYELSLLSSTVELKYICTVAHPS